MHTKGYFYAVIDPNFLKCKYLEIFGESQQNSIQKILDIKYYIGSTCVHAAYYKKTVLVHVSQEGVLPRTAI